MASYSPIVMAKLEAALPFRLTADLLPLHYNENSLGMSPNAFSAAKDALLKYGNRYAIGQIGAFSSTLAAHHQVDRDLLIMGNGSTEVISAVVTYAASLEATVIEPTPTFGALRNYSQSHGMKVISVPVAKDFTIDLEQMKQTALKQKKPVLINLCNPNNPTGNIVKHKALVDWISNAPDSHIFLIDEAYYDYAAQNNEYHSMLSMIMNGKDNVIVSRTFSKIYGMAGMRIGYGLATAKTARSIRPFSAGFNLNSMGIAAATASLADTKFYAKSVQSTAAAKTILTKTLDDLSLAYIPSHTNFILHQIRQPLSSYTAKMRDNNVKVGRKMTESAYWNRVSMGTPEQMQQFVKILRAFRERGWL